MSVSLDNEKKDKRKSQKALKRHHFFTVHKYTNKFVLFKYSNLYFETKKVQKKVDKKGENIISTIDQAMLPNIVKIAKCENGHKDSVWSKRRLASDF